MKIYFIGIIIVLYSALTLGNTIRITEGNSNPTPIAINNFAVSDQVDPQIAQNIISVIFKDLKFSKIFKPISQVALFEAEKGLRHKLVFAAWKKIGVELLLNGEITKTFYNKLKIKYTLFDTILDKNNQIVSESLELPEHLWRRAAHKISDTIYKKVTGYDGYFNTRIAYVSETGSYKNRIKRLAVMDYDGENHQYLTDGSHLVLTPRFSPDGKYILYLSYKNKIPQVYILSVRTGKTRLVGNFKGMSFAPTFSPDGKNILMSIAEYGSTHIYELNLKNKTIKQLTEGSSINTSPSYSPNGKQIVFNSDMYGTRQLFIMDRNGKNKKRISFGNGAYSDPVWSSNNYIAYIKMTPEYGFTLGVMNPKMAEKANTERIITTGYLIESPSWSRNGKALLFSKTSSIRQRNKNYNKKLRRIYMIDFSGYNERMLPTVHDASDPDWSNSID